MDIVERRLSEFLEICAAADVLAVLRALAYGGVNSDKLMEESARNGVVFPSLRYCGQSGHSTFYLKIETLLLKSTISTRCFLIKLLCT